MPGPRDPIPTVEMIHEKAGLRVINDTKDQIDLYREQGYHFVDDDRENKHLAQLAAADAKRRKDEDEDEKE